MIKKFNEVNRQSVVTELERILQCHFSKIGNSRKLFSDNAGHRYCVLGGVDNWHGVPKELIDSRDYDFKETFLIIAKKWKTKIDIFKDSIEPLIKNKDKLSSTNKQYQFLIKRIEQHNLRIRELPSYCPKKIAEIPYDDKIEEKEKRVFQFEKDMTKLSLEKLYQLEQKIKRKEKELKKEEEKKQKK